MSFYLAVLLRSVATLKRSSGRWAAQNAFYQVLVRNIAVFIRILYGKIKILSGFCKPKLIFIRIVYVQIRFFTAVKLAVMRRKLWDDL